MVIPGGLKGATPGAYPNLAWPFFCASVDLSSPRKRAVVIVAREEDGPYLQN